MVRQLGVLRTNYRKTGAELDLAAIGGGAYRGSQAAGSGTEGRWWGGHIILSHAVQTAAAYWAGSCQDFLASAIGAAAATAGVAIIPYAINVKDWTCSVPLGAQFASVSQCCVNFVFRGASTTAQTSTMSVHFVWAGFIASGPW